MNTTAKPFEQSSQEVQFQIQNFSPHPSKFLAFLPLQMHCQQGGKSTTLPSITHWTQKEQKPYPTSPLQQNNAASSDPLSPHPSCSHSTISPTQCSTSSGYLLVFFPKNQPIEKKSHFCWDFRLPNAFPRKMLNFSGGQNSVVSFNLETLQLDWLEHSLSSS